MVEYTFVLTARWFISITGYAVGDTEKHLLSGQSLRQLFAMQLRNNGRWNSEAFQSLYVPTFLQEMQNVAVKKKLNELVWLDRQGRRIALVCFCSDEATCHRSIIAGILQYVGIQIQGVQNNYHQYGGAYMNV